MKFYPNLLLIAGTGRNTGKTTLACNIINAFSEKEKIIGLKISPHFHGGTHNLKMIVGTKEYNIYEETSKNSGKDSSIMLMSGAERVFYIETTDEFIGQAFNHLVEKLNISLPIICESPALINYVKPGVFFIVDNQANIKKKKDVFKWENIADEFIHTDRRDLSEVVKKIVLAKDRWEFKV